MRRDARRGAKPDLSLGPDRHVSCQGKRSYASFTDANGQAQATRRAVSAPLSPYRCRHCTAWHVGTPPMKPKRNTKENDRDKDPA